MLLLLFLIIYEISHTATDLQYDKFKSTKEVIKSIRSEKEIRVIEKLTTQSLVVSSVWEQAMKSTNIIWLKTIATLPRNIYRFCIRYLNNSLSNGTKLNKCKKIPSPMCLFCNNQQTLGHVIASCVTSLNEKRYNFRHNSILLNIVRCIQDTQRLNICFDIAGLKYPTLIS